MRIATLHGERDIYNTSSELMTSRAIEMPFLTFAQDACHISFARSAITITISGGYGKATSVSGGYG
jgi:hypothetical protein